MTCFAARVLLSSPRYLHQEFLHLNDGLHDNNDDRLTNAAAAAATPCGACAQALSDRFYCYRYYSTLARRGPLRGSCLVAADLVHLIKSPFLLTSCKDVRFLIMNETYQFILDFVVLYYSTKCMILRLNSPALNGWTVH